MSTIYGEGFVADMMEAEGLPELPGATLFEDWGMIGYTADQMREYASAAVAAERERCAKVCEQIAHDALRDQPALQVLIHSSHGYRFAAAIRGNG
jgi:hypothetical protein